MLARFQPLLHLACVRKTPPLRFSCLNISNISAFSSVARKFNKPDNSSTANQIIKNERIRFPSMRVVYDDETGKSTWKIMTRIDALALATQKGLDLILVNGQSDPPVCKLELYKEKLAAVTQKVKENRQIEKARTLKEMFMTGGIEERDFNTKMKKVNEFLTKGHPVKVSIVPKKFLKNNRFKDGVRRDRMAGFDDTILMLLSFLENLQVSVTEQKVKAPPPPVAKFPSKDNKKKEKDLKNKNNSNNNQENNNIYDDNDLDLEDSDDDEPIDGKSEKFFGQKAIIRREFLVTPKTSMIIKPEKTDKKNNNYKKQDK